MSEQQDSAQQEGLTLNDLRSITSIIDVASQRGAFKPAEMVSVGTVYNRIQAFIAQVESQAQPAQEARNES